MNVAAGTCRPKIPRIMIDCRRNAGAILAIALALYLLARNPAAPDITVYDREIMAEVVQCASSQPRVA